MQSSNHIRDAWSHIWGSIVDPGAHRIQLGSIVDREFPELMRKKDEREEMALTLLEEAVAEKCRSTVELVGHARDRRCLNHTQEVFQEGNCKTLMCFICNSKHVYYHGLNKFGIEYNAGRIDYRNSDADRAVIFQLLSGKTNFFAANLCAKRFRNNYGRQLLGMKCFSVITAGSGDKLYKGKVIVKLFVIQKTWYAPLYAPIPMLALFVTNVIYPFVTSAGVSP